MILHLAPDADEQLIGQFREHYHPAEFFQGKTKVSVISSSVKELHPEFQPLFSQAWVMDSDIQLANRQYLDEKRQVQLGAVSIGGTTQNMAFIAGPCSVESREQLWTVCEHLKSAGISLLRGGAFKPRTSPYSFQGLGTQGLELLREAREEFQLGIVSEVRDATHVDEVIEAVDVIQVGAKAMYDQGILRACGRARKPVLLKRGFGSTLQEFVQAAEFILASGNEQVVLCERGIRTFENKTRFTLDLCGVAYLKKHTNLPIIVDPSHAMGFRYGVGDLARAATAMGIDGLLIEAHPKPSEALSDAAQQLELSELSSLKQSVEAIARIVGKTLV